MFCRWRMGRNTSADVVVFAALMSTALALGGALAHLLELPNKIDMPRDQYFVVQSIYRGWNQLAYLLAIELVSMIALLVISRHEPKVILPAAIALVCLIASQAVFWIYTYPANVATSSWTSIPENWEALRLQWEYSHAAGAAFQILAMAGLIVAATAQAR